MEPEIVVAICAIIISILSLGISIYFNWCARDHNKRSVLPLPFILQLNYEDQIKVAIQNKGAGPLIVINALCQQNREQSSGHLIDIIPEPPSEVRFRNFNKVQQRRAILPGEEIVLIDLEVDEENQNEVLYRDSLREFLGHIRLEVEYTNIYEKKFPTYCWGLKWFHE